MLAPILAPGRAIVPIAIALVLARGSAQTPAEPTQDSPIDLAAARDALALLRDVSARGQHLWGEPLAGPTLFVDPATKAVVADRADADGRLQACGELFCGALGEQTGVANTAVTWSGTRWSMLMWPLPGDRDARARLLAHESFHRLQQGLGLPMGDPPNPHLDRRDGRTWMRLEVRALAQGLETAGESSATAVRDAMLFRAQRHALCAGASASEPPLVLNEGLAEYTGIAASTRTAVEARAQAARAMREHERMEGMMRDFAYRVGPAYGLLLDTLAPTWRKDVRADTDIGAVLAKAAGFASPDDLATLAQTRAKEYGGDEVIQQEQSRETLRAEKQRKYRALFADGPVLTLALGKDGNFSYDPRTLETLDGVGTVYPTIKVIAAWGTLDVRGGALKNDRGEFLVPAPKDASARSTDGWTLTLAAGWELAPGARAGDFVVRKTP